MQYRHEERSCKGTFLLAVCNNVAVLHHEQLLSRHGKATNSAVSFSGGDPCPHFNYLRRLLGRYAPSGRYTADEAALWSKCSQNVLQAMGFGDMSYCAGAG